MLYGHSLANIKAAAFDYNMSIEILVIVVLGGMGSVPGSVISAIVLTGAAGAARGGGLPYAGVCHRADPGDAGHEQPHDEAVLALLREKLTREAEGRAAL